MDFSSFFTDGKNALNPNMIKLIESVVLIAILIILRSFIGKVIDRVANKFDYNKNRVKVFKKLFRLIALIIGAIVLLGIWGVKQAELTLFVSSILTVLGIAFFAQWSILSNITSTIIIFFNHPVSIGDELEILDKDFPVKGTIQDIGIFFITVKTESGEIISTPSSVMMQKMIKRSAK
ncbi:MAG: mechanosensitive ion channel domain-containing protein [Bacteroidota bacterium]